MTSDPRVVNPIELATERLAAAFRTGVGCAPVRDLLGTDDIDAAYLVQQANIRRETAAGITRVGRKIGLTSVAVQQQLGVDQPDFGTLTSAMRVGLGETVAHGRLMQPRIEAEIAFVLSRDLDGDRLDRRTVADAVGSAFAALEIVDSRIAGWDISIVDTVADNASSGLFVLGDEAVALTDFDPVEAAMTLTQDGTEVASGTGAACLGDPLLAVEWLAQRCAAMGDPLRRGEIVLSGALGPMVTVRPGSSYEATIVGLGTVRAAFAAAPGTVDERKPS